MILKEQFYDRWTYIYGKGVVLNEKSIKYNHDK